ncbi:Uncharacterised protein g11377 [Pycnogonum litorale]
MSKYRTNITDAAKKCNSVCAEKETDHESSGKDGHATSDAEEDLSPEESECSRCLGEAVQEKCKSVCAGDETDHESSDKDGKYM